MTENLLNQKFGKLLVVEFEGKRGKSFYWKCLCDCGNFHTVRSQNLKGNTKSCGCWGKDGSTKKMFKDETGNKYEKLTAIKYIGNRKWEFICDCGEKCTKDIADVRRGKVRSCGCLKKEYQQKRKNGEVDFPPNYNPNMTDTERERLRVTPEYREWQNNVKKKNNFTCQKCNQLGGKLTSHHIRSFIEYPELRYEITNGITFCKKCHKKFHSIYGVKRFNEENLKEYLHQSVV
jgi:5-methylcytosine-specific restriction endonuclease McrA